MWSQTLVLMTRTVKSQNVFRFNTWFFNTQAEDVGHISAGVGSDGVVVVLLSPLDQGLSSCRQLLLHRLRHLHQSLGASIQANAV